jgi:lysine/ornithine N-monooxygenase
MEDLSFQTDQWKHQLDMLTKSKTAAQKAEILLTLSKQKSSAELLNDVAASRQQHKYRPLPGLGHPYWRTARDHLQLSTIPPRINIDMKPVMTLLKEPIQRIMVNLLKETWISKPGAKFGCEYDQYTSHITNSQTKNSKNIPVIRIPVIKLDDQGNAASVTEYQDGQPWRSKNLVLFHGTREGLVGQFSIMDYVQAFTATMLLEHG